MTEDKVGNLQIPRSIMAVKENVPGEKEGKSLAR